jgi:hypothetical protein
LGNIFCASTFIIAGIINSYNLYLYSVDLILKFFDKLRNKVVDIEKGVRDCNRKTALALMGLFREMTFALQALVSVAFKLAEVFDVPNRDFF